MFEVSQSDLDEAVKIFTEDPNTYVKAAEHEFRKGAVRAAKQIVEIALHAESDKVRLDACKYITDRVLGKVRDKDIVNSEKEPWEDILGAVTREPTAEERIAGMRVTG